MNDTLVHEIALPSGLFKETNLSPKKMNYDVQTFGPKGPKKALF